jgi:hypothetical protein
MVQGQYQFQDFSFHCFLHGLLYKLNVLGTLYSLYFTVLLLHLHLDRLQGFSPWRDADAPYPLFCFTSPNSTDSFFFFDDPTSYKEYVQIYKYWLKGSKKPLYPLSLGAFSIQGTG